MNVSTLFILRPVATILLSIALMLGGVVAYRFLPVAAMPSVDIPTIVVFAARPGADPDTIANSVAAPLERRLGEIAGVTEITSTSAVGNTAVIIQFDIDRDIDGAAYDVQAAINAAMVDLPGDLPTRPYYRKFNPADTPVLRIALASDTLPTAKIFDAADTILAQRLSQVEGVSQVTVNGSEKSAVRIRLDPVRLAAANLSAQDVYNTVRDANVLQPLGALQGPERSESIGVNGQIRSSRDYAPLIIKSGNGAILRLTDVASVVDATTNARLAAWNGDKPAILLSIAKQAGANAIETADRVRALLPQLIRWLPPDINVTIIADRTTTIRASIDDIRITLLITIILVLLVVLLFMRRLAPTLAAAVTVPLSIAGTLASMWFQGFSLDNFSLMALTISVGFVVDDAIVMIENIVRHIEHGQTPVQAAITGARQISFTILSISLSLVAVFIPLIFMGGLIGRVLHEFAMTLTMAIAVSALVSLTLTPMICGRYIRATTFDPPASQLWRSVDATIGRILVSTEKIYAVTLDWALAHRLLMLTITAATIVLTIRMYGLVPKGFMPLQDIGIINGATVADIDVSFQTMAQRQRQVVDVLLTDPAVDSVTSTVGVAVGWDAMNRGQIAIGLKPLNQRGVSSEAVIDRLRDKLAQVRGIQTYLYSAQELRPGGRDSGAQFQFVLLSPDVALMREWSDKLVEKLRQTPGLADVSSDQDKAAPQANVVIDRDAAARLGVTAANIDDALGNAYAQRQISTIYSQRNQYKVVLEVDPRLQTDPSMLNRLYVGGAGGKQVPLSAVAKFEAMSAPVRVRHQGQFPAATISFNLPPGTSLGRAEEIVQAAVVDLRMPENVHTEFAGNAAFLQKSLSTQPLLIGAAIIAMYIVLGVLYESLLHPLTIISTLPSAGLGALLALWATGTELSVMGIVGIILLMGIVKKNAIMMVDFALEAQRQHGLAPFAAIHAACLARFRPIIMTTMAAIFGALPLALAWGTGSELRRPLGISIVGGLIVSQMLTLYTTPVVFLALERLAGHREAIVRPSPAE